MPTTKGAVTYVRAGGGRSFAHLGTSLTFKDEPGDDADALLCFEMRMPPDHGVPPHTERNAEAFYVLEGTLDVDADGDRYRLGRGDLLRLAPGVRHALHNPGPAWAHALTWVTPGAQHVRFFERLGEPIDDPRNPPQPDGPPDLAELIRVARECGMDFEAP
jgi:quercetin dioxygenase-like cupin family protein